MRLSRESRCGILPCDRKPLLAWRPTSTVGRFYFSGPAGSWTPDEKIGSLPRHLAPAQKVTVEIPSVFPNLNSRLQRHPFVWQVPVVHGAIRPPYETTATGNAAVWLLASCAPATRVSSRGAESGRMDLDTFAETYSVLRLVNALHFRAEYRKNVVAKRLPPGKFPASSWKGLATTDRASSSRRWREPRIRPFLQRKPGCRLPPIGYSACF